MKKLLMTLAAVVAFAACDDDDKPGAWESLPTTPITGENATLTVNGNPSAQGSVQLTATSATTGELLLTNVLPGYAAINMEVTLTERTDGTGTFDLAGETGLTTPPAMIARAATEPVIFNVSARGYITPEGKAAVTLTSALSTEAQGGLTEKWDLIADLPLDEDFMIMNTPLWITWSAKDQEQANAEQTAMTVRQFGSSFLYQFLHSITFSADGNITAEYWDGEGFNMQNDMATYLMSGLDYNDDFTGAFIKIIRENPQWSESPKGLLYWYVKDGYLYIVPDIAAILAQIKEDSGTDVAGGQSGITSLLASLGEYGIDIDKLLPLVMQWMETGIPFRYEKTESGLKLYADKEMCAPVIEALLPALPKLDEKIEKLVAENPDDEMIQYLPSLKFMLGIESFASLDPIWKNNTDQFEFSLNFVNKAQ